MKRYQTVTEERERRVLMVHSCDLCGKSTHIFKRLKEKEVLYEFAARDWDMSGECPGNHCVTEISHEFGDVWPEGKFTKKLEFHICPSCFKEKLIPWFREQGAEVTEVDTTDDRW